MVKYSSLAVDMKIDLTSEVLQVFLAWSTLSRSHSPKLVFLDDNDSILQINFKERAQNAIMPFVMSSKVLDISLLPSSTLKKDQATLSSSHPHMTFYSSGAGAASGSPFNAFSTSAPRFRLSSNDTSCVGDVDHPTPSSGYCRGIGPSLGNMSR